MPDLTTPARPASEVGPASRWLHLLGLSGFALAQPLFDLLARQPSFLVVQKLAPAEIVALALVLTFAAPTLLWTVEMVVSLMSGALGAALHHIWIAILIGLGSLPILKSLGLVGTAPLLCSAAALGIASTVGYAKVAALRSFANLIGVSSLAFAVIFLASPAVRGLVMGGGASELGVDASACRTSVVMLILDELPISSLLDETGNIDAARFPAFARLAAASTWFRNATTIHGFTLVAVPAILTGTYPAEKGKPPNAGNYPRNLFGILRNDYVLNVEEALTALHDGDEDHREPPLQRAGDLARDLYYVYLHVVLPSAMTERLPSVERSWKHFGRARKADRFGHGGSRGRPLRFQRFVESIRGSDQPTLHFVHLLLPHTPWQYLPSGGSYEPVRTEGTLAGSWPKEPWWGLASFQRHLLQLQFVDRLLGQLIDRLDVTGLWDSALVVVTADHGASYWPGGAHRDMKRTTHPEDILNVPLFIKRPHQATATKSLQIVQSVDVLPTILDLLDIEVPWEMDGCSAYDPACAERQEIVAFAPKEYLGQDNTRVVFARDVLERRDTLDRKIEHFGAGEDQSELYRFTIYRDLVGQRLSDTTVTAVSGGQVRIDVVPDAHRLTPKNLVVPARISGTLELAGPEPERPYVAVAVDGIVRTVVPAPRDGQDGLRDQGVLSDDYRGLRVAAMLPESVVRSGNKPLLYLVSGPPESPVLQPLQVVWGSRALP